MPVVESIALHETARKRYLNYALSVITSRALPDIRDGLKPVQRRILYAMFANLHLYPDGRYRKSATVVGEVMGKFHPHGDTAIYDAMVRMAQPFALRVPLVDGHGNFGSLDGDSAAAMRYTEAKLRAPAMELLEDIRKQTVDFRPNFDGTLSEPIVLPARIPNLLINGSSGIAVGMATNIPPHNLTEVIDALLYCIDNPEAQTAELVEKFVQGPDFPTGGRILNTREEIATVYEKGEGAIDVRGEYEVEGKTKIIIRSIPYGITKSDLIEKIAEHIEREHVPQLTDVRDESTDDVRIVLELRRGAEAEPAMAYLFKHTPLQNRFSVNLTCLVPTDNPGIQAPQRVNLQLILHHFLTFRMEVTVRRLRYELEQIERRIHILRGFEIIFDALDEAIRIIRSSKDKNDAAQRLMHRFALDDEQTDAILETKLYKLAQLEIEAIRRELEEKERQAAELRRLLEDEEARWELIRAELRAMRERYGDPRRSIVAGPDEQLEYSKEAYIVDEDVVAIVTRDGWIKRQKSYTDINAIRVREGDEVGWALGGSTRSTIGVFSNLGRVYTTRINALTSTAGYGDPVQKLFDFTDKERIVGVICFDERVLPAPTAPRPERLLFEGEPPPAGPYVVAVSSKGQCVRFTLEGIIEPSNKAGRGYMKLEDGDQVLGVELVEGTENVCTATMQGHCLIFPVSQIAVFKGAAKGVVAMRMGPDDRIVGFVCSTRARDGLIVETNRGRREIIRTTKFEVSKRGNKGPQIIKRGLISKVVTPPVEVRLNGAAGTNGNGNSKDGEHV